MCDTRYGRDLLAALKATAGRSGPHVTIPVGRPPTAVLRPVATRHERLDADDIRLLTEWRNRHVGAFLTEFQASESRTARWLTDVVGPGERKILFMVDDSDGATIGCIGLDHIDWKQARGEADTIIRGAGAAPGTMKLSLQTLLAWARGQLGLLDLAVRVRSDNTAIEFYEKVGFRETHRIALARVETPEMVRWVEDETMENPDVHLVHMFWDPSPGVRG